jgi:DNA-binding transcriptional MerR regulator
MVGETQHIEDRVVADLGEIVQMLGRETERWRDQLAVSIGRASELTGLKESQIRYFEEIEALQPQKTTDQRGASRLYTISDLRRLYALAQLTRQNYRPAEAARIVRTNAPFIESGVHRSVAEVVTTESHVLRDGFVLSRVLSQIVLACQAELEVQAKARGLPAIPRIRAALLPQRELPNISDPNHLAQLGQSLGESLSDTFVVLDREAFAPSLDDGSWPSPPRVGSDESFVMFYSRETWSIPRAEIWHYVLYVGQEYPCRAIVLLLDNKAPGDSARLEPEASARRDTLNRLLDLAAKLGQQFRAAALSSAYRSCTDGMSLAYTHHDFAEILRLICRAVLRDDETATAVLLIPDRLMMPNSLSILAHYNYITGLIPHARLDITGEPSGLSGRAFRYRELFLTRDARNDPRIASEVEERCACAMAIPLTLAWTPTTYGVLYLASQQDRPGLSLDSYLAWILSTILTELLAQWWTTRVRLANDQHLHREMRDMVAWLDGLGPYGPSYAKVLEELVARWRQLKAEPDSFKAADYLALIVFDIDNHTNTLQKTETEPLLLRAQRHVREAIERIVSKPQAFWFKNDHTILLLERQAPAHTAGDVQEILRREIEELVRRIARQVRMVPLSLDDGTERSVTISVSAAGKVLSLQDFVDLHHTEAGIPRRLHQILDELRRKAGEAPGASILIE